MTEKMDTSFSNKVTTKHSHSICMLFLITTTKLSKKGEQMFEEGHINTVYRSYGKGTASNEIMDMLGLSDVDKSITISMLPKVFADEMLKKLKKQLQLGLANTGIAFTIPISGANSRILKLVEQLQSEESNTTNIQVERRENKMEESMYSLIMVIVDRGYSEEVMEAARPQGATGGTVINTRWVAGDEALNFWGIPVQSEKEIVMILATHNDKKNIMQAIGEKCGTHSEAHGVILSLPVDGVVGID